MAAFLLAALLCWVRGRPGRWRWTAVLVLFGLALLAKESAVVLPVVLSALEVTRECRRPIQWQRLGRAALRPWPVYVELIVYLVLRLAVPGAIYSDSIRDEFIGDSLLRLVARSGSLVVRSWLPGMGPGWWLVVGVALAVLAGAVMTGRRRRHSAGATASAPPPETWSPGWPAVFCCVASVVVLAPVARMGAAAIDSGGERLVYLPSAFTAIVAAWLLVGLMDRRATLGRIAVAVVLGAGALALVASNLRWRQAGDVARSVGAQMAAWPRDRQVYLLATPDNLGGAYVLRNSAGMNLVWLHGWSNPPRFDELSTVRLAGPHDRLDVRRGDAPHTWRVRLTAPGSQFVQVADEPSTRVDDVAVRRRGSREIEARFPPTVTADQIWFFSAGRLVSVADLPPD